MNSMTKQTKKKTSTHCPIEQTLSLIVGKWKTVILWHLSSGTKRYGELKKLIPEVSEKMLIQSLRDLERDSLVTRSVYHEVPPRVDYTLTKKAESLKPILTSMDNWGKKNL
jgi:DNA-binding HxlR family transcriptional regulator